MASMLLDWLESLSADDWDQRPAGRWEGSLPASPAAVESAEANFGVQFPRDYRELLLASDGGELGCPRGSIMLERVEDLVDRNTEERYEIALPGMIVIGTDSGDAVYFYDPTNLLKHDAWALYWVDLGELGMENARFAGKDLGEVLRRIAAGVSFFDEPKIDPDLP